jgi:Ca2+-binding RTX toxin-like protein
MASLLIATSTDFRSAPAETDIDELVFQYGEENIIATFAPEQFGAGLVAPWSSVQGSGASETIRVIASSAANFSAIDWVFSDWSADDRIQLFGSSGADSLTGSHRADLVRGNGGADTLDGAGGDDTIVASGSVTAIGSYGIDTLLVTGGDTVYEGIGARDFRSVSLSGFERLEFATSAATAAMFSITQIGSGLSLDASIVGGASQDVLVIFGGGNINTPFDLSDEAFSFENWDWAVDRLVLTLPLTFGANRITGTRYSETIIGSNGPDTLSGGLGADTMIGGAYADRYVDPDFAAGDVIVEDVNPEIGGFDSILSHGDFSMALAPEGIEALYLSGGAAIRGWGNHLANFIEGSSAGNILRGLLGDDTLDGGGGRDTLAGGDGDDRLSGQNGDDRLMGGAGADYLWGEDGIDTLIGGVGNDIYFRPDDDVIVESVGGGRDTVIIPYAHYVMPDNVENLQFFLEYGNDAIGNASHNIMQGNQRQNRLEGLAGNDTLHGGDSADVLIGGEGNDVLQDSSGQFSGGLGNDTYITGGGKIIELAGEGTDTVVSYHSSGFGLTDLPHVENLTLGGSTGEWGEGNALANAIVGNANDNLLKGHAADDTINGGLGADRIRGGEDNDRLFGNEGDDSLYGETGQDRLFGGSGHDTLNGGNGNDTMRGEEGDDRLVGGAGNDTMDGGAGADVFGFQPGAAGADRIENFSFAEDRFDLASGGFSAMTEVNGNTRLTHAGGTVAVIGVTGHTLAEWNALVSVPDAMPSETPPWGVAAMRAYAGDYLPNAGAGEYF